MPEFTHVSLLPVFLLALVSLGIGLVWKAALRGKDAYLQAAQGITAWVVVPAFCATLLGASELLGLSALAAGGGMWQALGFALGFVPALLLTSRWAATRLADAQAGTVAGLLGERYGRRVRSLSACIYVALYVLGAALALGVAARAVQGMHVLDALVRGRGWTVESIYPGVGMLSAMVVLLGMLWGGLTASLYARALQFCVLLVGLLPLTLQGASSAGGWSALAVTDLSGVWMHPLLAAGVGVLAGLGVGSADFRLLQVLAACRKRAILRRVPLLALLPLLAVFLLVILPGAAAPLLPTPQNVVSESVIEGAIVRTTSVVRPEEAAGRGLTPAQTDAATGSLLRQGGFVRLEYAMAAPKLAMKTLRERGLGLFLAALLAALLSGVSAQLTASVALLDQDLLPLFWKRPAEDPLRIVRWLTAGVMVVVAALAMALRSHGLASTQLLLLYSATACAVLGVAGLGMRTVPVRTARRQEKARRKSSGF